MQDVLDLLRDLRDGGMLTDASKALGELREAVQTTGKPGVLTITITMKPASKGNREIFAFMDAITTKKPVGEKQETILFASGERFSRRDPRQPELPSMRAVSPDESANRQEAVND